MRHDNQEIRLIQKTVEQNSSLSPGVTELQGLVLVDLKPTILQNKAEMSGQRKSKLF